MINLYLIFFKIGMLCFGGGYVILPLIEEYLVKNGYIDYNTFIDVISISQMTPGPIAINSATFIGMKNFGFLGMIIASLAVISFQTIILIIFSKFIDIKNIVLKKILSGLKLATISFLIIASINIFKISIFNEKKVNYIGLLCFLLVLVLEKFKIKNTKKLLICTFLLLFLNFSKFFLFFN